MSGPARRCSRRRSRRCVARRRPKAAMPKRWSDRCSPGSALRSASRSRREAPPWGARWQASTCAARPARAALAQMEDVRAALLEGSWHADVPAGEKLRVIRFSSSARLREVANPGMSAFYQPVDLFGDPFLLLTDDAAQGDVVLKHEL